MPTLLEQLQSATDGSNLSADIGGQAGSFLQIAQLVQQLIDQPPGDFSGYLSHLQSLPLPQVSVAGDLGDAFSGILPALQGDTSGLLEPLLGAVGNISQNVGGDLGETFNRLLSIIQDLQTLFASDLSCGLVAALEPLPAPALPAPPAEGEPQPAPTPLNPPAVVSQEQVDQAKAMVESLPADMTVPALLTWLHQQVGTHRPDYFFFRSIPVLDDLRDPLDSLVRWDGYNGTQLVQELEQTLTTLVAIVQSNTTEIISQPFNTPAIAAIPATAIASSAGQLAAALEALLVAVNTVDESEISSQLGLAQNAATDLENANLSLDTQQTELDALRSQLETLPSRMETAICRLLVLLQPRATWGDLSAHLGEAPVVLETDTFAPVTDLLGRVQEFLENLLNLVDIGAVTDPLVEIFTQAANAIDSVEQGIVQATASVRAAFEQAHAALQLLDIEHAQQQAEQALQDATQEVTDALSQGLGPAIDALSQAMSAIDGALGDFDPEQLGAPVQQVFDAISSIFQSPAVQEIVSQLERLKALAEELDDLSFKPVSNVVIEGIDTIKSALDAIDESSLVAPMPEMIGEAMSVLPESLTPLTDPLISELDNLIEQGPIPLLEAVRDLPEPVFQHLRNFSPRELLEEPLGTPFREMRAKLDEFQPTQWLDAAEQELDALKQRLADSMDLQPLLAPIVEAQQQLLSELEGFRPGAFLEPLTQGIEQALQGLDGALPTSELTDGLQQVFNQVQRLIDTLDAANEVVQSVSGRLALLSDPDAQLNQWLDTILAKLPADAPATLAAILGSLGQAIEDAKAAPLQSAYDTAKQPLLEKLNEADTQALQTRIIQGKSRLTPLLDDLPPSTAKTDLQAWLAGFDPAAPAFSRGLRQLTRLQSSLNATDAALTQSFTNWDAYYHRADGILANLIPESFTLEELRQWLREAIDRQLGQPLVGFLKQLKVLGGLLQAFGDTIGSLLQAINTKLTELLAAPMALLQASQELEQLQERLTNLDLGIFTREIDSLYTQLVEQLRSLNPRNMEAALRQVLEQALDALSLDLVFTPGLRQQLEETYASLVGIIDGLDPELLIIAPMEQTYEQDILPLVDALDVSDAIQAIIDLLNRLPDDLQSELTRVDGSYQQLLAAAPSGSSGGASASVSL
jgi:hypothetical protein